MELLSLAMMIGMISSIHYALEIIKEIKKMKPNNAKTVGSAK